MIRKPPLRTVVPRIPDVPAQEAYTVCPAQPAGPPPTVPGGSWVLYCVTGPVMVGVGADHKPIYETRTVCHYIWSTGGG